MSSSPQPGIAFFDFDGTITRRDSLPEFIRYAVGNGRYILGLLRLSPMLLAYLLKLLPNDVAKQRLLSHFFANWREDDLKEIGKRYCQERLPQNLKPEALERLEWHRQQAHQIVIVSASTDIWLQPWTEEHGYGLISTQLETDGGRLTGRFVGKNCHGAEKARRIKAEFNLENFTDTYAYGDSSGDREMLALVKHAFYQRFR